MLYANSPRDREIGLIRTPNKVFPAAIRVNANDRRRRGSVSYAEGNMATAMLMQANTRSEAIPLTEN